MAVRCACEFGFLSDDSMKNSNKEASILQLTRNLFTFSVRIRNAFLLHSINFFVRISADIFTDKKRNALQREALAVKAVKSFR